ncbi:hypothetical protein M899_0847 [Bacteriovorax sp. BSW11_IV]|uniref:hypothetical protein n=1 Tax=Bacteriovorax sp. BSW11_IV TaxID=1353529 RepID=UPI00038A1077|nr:hypothetical protein [Bacteriovorax sp. BSW11_IV]EQC42972.1 hypothetical protein M899_0847 [Bacteriovorax sp. BSW11_IV]
MKKFVVCLATLLLFVFSLFGEELHRLSHAHEQDCHVHIVDNCHEVSNDIGQSEIKFADNPCPLAISLHIVRTLKNDATPVVDLTATDLFEVQSFYKDQIFISFFSFNRASARAPPIS